MLSAQQQDVDGWDKPGRPIRTSQKISAGLEVWGDGNASMGKTCGLRGRRTVCNGRFGLIDRRGRAAREVARASGGRTAFQGEGDL
jgi:hypothetical protein